MNEYKIHNSILSFGYKIINEQRIVATATTVPATEPKYVDVHHSPSTSTHSFTALWLDAIYMLYREHFRYLKIK